MAKLSNTIFGVSNASIVRILLLESTLIDFLTPCIAYVERDRGHFFAFLLVMLHKNLLSFVYICIYL